MQKYIREKKRAEKIHKDLFVSTRIRQRNYPSGHQDDIRISAIFFNGTTIRYNSKLHCCQWSNLIVHLIDKEPFLIVHKFVQKFFISFLCNWRFVKNI